MSRRAILVEALGLWAAAFLAVVAASLLAPPAAKLVAVVAFLYLPLWAMRRSGEDARTYGMTLARWKTDVLLAVALFAVIAPVYFFLWKAWMVWDLSHGRTGPPPGFAFHPRLPPDFGWWAVDQLAVTALPEEFFFRGWLQARLSRVWPGGARILGVVIGPAFLLTAVLFALVHLTQFRTYRLAVFFPALLFGWLRERTGTIVGSTLFHAACNLYAQFLGASFTPLWDGR
jgi:membrane protease YdiL (CAAX protease family)